VTKLSKVQERLKAASVARAISGVEQGQGSCKQSARRVSRLGEAVHEGERCCLTPLGFLGQGGPFISEVEK